MKTRDEIIAEVQALIDKGEAELSADGLIIIAAKTSPKAMLNILQQIVYSDEFTQFCHSLPYKQGQEIVVARDNMISAIRDALAKIHTN